MTDYLARVALSLQGKTAGSVAYENLHTALEEIGLLRVVRSRADGHLYMLPHATYAGRCERDVDDMLMDIRDAVRGVLPKYNAQIVLGACFAIVISGLQKVPLDRSLNFLVDPERFVVTC